MALFVLLLWGVWSTVAHTPPSNDNCRNAPSIFLTTPNSPSTVTEWGLFAGVLHGYFELSARGSTHYATFDAPYGSCFDNPNGADVWFQLKASFASGTVVNLRTCWGADFDTTLSAYRCPTSSQPGCGTQDQYLGCSGDVGQEGCWTGSGLDLVYSMSFSCYLIKVSGPDACRGNFVLSAGYECPQGVCPTTVAPTTIDVPLATNDRCENASVIPLGGLPDAHVIEAHDIYVTNYVTNVATGQRRVKMVMQGTTFLTDADEVPTAQGCPGTWSDSWFRFTSDRSLLVQFDTLPLAPGVELTLDTNVAVYDCPPVGQACVNNVRNLSFLTCNEGYPGDTCTPAAASVRVQLNTTLRCVMVRVGGGNYVNWGNYQLTASFDCDGAHCPPTVGEDPAQFSSALCPLRFMKTAGFQGSFAIEGDSNTSVHWEPTVCVNGDQSWFPAEGLTVTTGHRYWIRASIKWNCGLSHAVSELLTPVLAVYADWNQDNRFHLDDSFNQIDDTERDPSTETLGVYHFRKLAVGGDTYLFPIVVPEDATGDVRMRVVLTTSDVNQDLCRHPGDMQGVSLNYLLKVRNASDSGLLECGPQYSGALNGSCEPDTWFPSGTECVRQCPAGSQGGTFLQTCIDGFWSPAIAPCQTRACDHFACPVRDGLPLPCVNRPFPAPNTTAGRECVCPLGFRWQNENCIFYGCSIKALAHRTIDEWGTAFVDTGNCPAVVLPNTPCRMRCNPALHLTTGLVFCFDGEIVTTDTVCLLEGATCSRLPTPGEEFHAVADPNEPRGYYCPIGGVFRNTSCALRCGRGWYATGDEFLTCGVWGNWAAQGGQCKEACPSSVSLVSRDSVFNTAYQFLMGSTDDGETMYFTLFKVQREPLLFDLVLSICLRNQSLDLHCQQAIIARDFIGNGGFDPFDMALRSRKFPVIAYSQSGLLYVVVCYNSTCSNVTTTAMSQLTSPDARLILVSGAVNSMLRLRLNPTSGFPVIAFDALDGGVRYYLCQNLWCTQSIGRIVGDALNVIGDANNHVSMAVSSQGIVWMCWSSSGTLRYAFCEDGNPLCVGERYFHALDGLDFDGESNAGFRSNVVMAIGDRPVAVYSYLSGPRGRRTVMMARCESMACNQPDRVLPQQLVGDTSEVDFSFDVGLALFGDIPVIWYSTVSPIRFTVRNVIICNDPGCSAPIWRNQFGFYDSPGVIVRNVFPGYKSRDMDPRLDNVLGARATFDVQPDGRLVAVFPFEKLVGESMASELWMREFSEPMSRCAASCLVPTWPHSPRNLGNCSATGIMAHGEVCSFTCDLPFVLNMESFECYDGKISRAQLCVRAADCPLPAVSSAVTSGNCTEMGDTLGVFETCTYGCRPGYFPVPGSSPLYCNNGTLYGAFDCRLLPCVLPPVDRNSTTAGTCPVDELRSGETCAYECKSGYSMEPPNSDVSCYNGSLIRYQLCVATAAADVQQLSSNVIAGISTAAVLIGLGLAALSWEFIRQQRAIRKLVAINDAEVTWITTKLANGEMTRLKLGEGYQSIVFEGSWRNKRVALKVFRLHVGENTKSRAEQRCLREALVYHGIAYNHGIAYSDRVIKCLGVCMTAKNPYMVLSFVDGRSCYEIMNDGQTFPLRLDEMMKPDMLENIRNLCWVCVQAADGLRHIHGQDVIHGDFSAKNVLVDVQNNFDTQICDFGNGRQARERRVPTFETGSDPMSFAWCAPEVLAGGSRSPQADVYSFGVFLLEVHIRAFNAAELFGLSKRTAGLTPDSPECNSLCIPTTITELISELITQCTNPQPTSRPTMEGISKTLNRFHDQLRRCNTKNYDLIYQHPYDRRLKSPIVSEVQSPTVSPGGHDSKTDEDVESRSHSESIQTPQREALASNSVSPREASSGTANSLGVTNAAAGVVEPIAGIELSYFPLK